MYVTVHKIGNQWFRDDNGALVGTEVSLAIPHHRRYYERLGNDCVILIIDTDNRYNQIYKGFRKMDGTLVRYKDSMERYAFVLD